MHYLLSVQHRISPTGDYQLSVPDHVSTDDLFTAVAALNADLATQGAWVVAGGLQAPSEGCVVDASGPEGLVTDDPDTRTNELLGGFWVIDTTDRETALDWARRASAAVRQEIHVRPFQTATSA